MHTHAHTHAHTHTLMHTHTHTHTHSCTHTLMHTHTHTHTHSCAHTHTHTHTLVGTLLPHTQADQEALLRPAVSSYFDEEAAEEGEGGMSGMPPGAEGDLPITRPDTISATVAALLRTCRNQILGMVGGCVCGGGGGGYWARFTTYGLGVGLL